MPPAFILSQDQTLHCKKFDRLSRGALFFGSTVQLSNQGASRLNSGNLTLFSHLHCAVQFPRSTPRFRGNRILLYTTFSFLQIALSFFFEFAIIQMKKRDESHPVSKVRYTIITNEDFSNRFLVFLRKIFVATCISYNYIVEITSAY